MDWSTQQKTIFDKVKNSRRNLFISALAGTGKTTTLVRLSEEIDPTQSTIFMCFGKNDQLALEARVPSNVLCKTLHSKGLADINAASRANGGGWIKPNDWKCSDIYDQLSQNKDLKAITLELVGYGKTVATKHPDWDSIITVRNLSVNGEKEKVIELAEAVFQKSLQNTKVIDFDDMLLFPALGLVPCKQYDNILIDEQQDLSSVQMTLVWRTLKKGGRIIGVGDEHQAIYFFRGADAKAVKLMVDYFKMETLPLSVSFRCSQAVIRQAQKVVPEIEAAPWAPEGSVQTIKDTELMDKLQTGDWVLCRTNAPLVPICLDLIRQGVKAVIRGKDVAEQIAGTARKVIKLFNCTDDNVVHFLKCMDAYRANETAKLLAENKAGSAQALEDRCMVISALSEGVTKVSQISEKLKAIFSDNPNAPIVCSTIHKAKGQEADNIFLVNPEQIPHPMAKTEDEKAQEMNILYVAYTRAKINFFTVLTTKTSRQLNVI